MEGYPRWWPCIRSVHHIETDQDDDAYEVILQSALPYALRVRLRQRVVSRADGVLEAVISGDVEGTGRWTVTARHGVSTTVVYEQVCTLEKRSLQRWSRLLRPLYVLNHRLAMRSAARGLEAG